MTPAGIEQRDLRERPEPVCRRHPGSGMVLPAPAAGAPATAAVLRHLKRCGDSLEGVDCYEKVETPGPLPSTMITRGEWAYAR